MSSLGAPTLRYWDFVIAVPQHYGSSPPRGIVSMDVPGMRGGGEGDGDDDEGGDGDDYAAAGR